MTFHSGATATADHMPLLAWNITDEFLWNGSQTTKLSVLTDIGTDSDVPVDHDGGLARLSIHIAAGTAEFPGRREMAARAVPTGRRLS